MKNLKLVCICLILFSSLYFVFADEDDFLEGQDVSSDQEILTDEVSIKPTKKESPISLMKFRGSLTLGGYYRFANQTGYRNSDTEHISHVSYSPLDYQQSADPLNKHHNDGKGAIVGSTWGGLKGAIFATYSAIAPFLATDHFLFKDNNINVTLNTDLSPVSLFQGISVSITPIAFLKFKAGCAIGSGWPIGDLLNGLGINDGSCADGKRQPFYGAVFTSFLQCTLQFDVAAVMPKQYKRWTHVVMSFSPQFVYRSLLNVDSETSWQLNNDSGDNFNGWSLEGTFVLGYQIPIIIDDTGANQMFLKMRNNNFSITAAMMFLIDKFDLSHCYKSTMASGGWGSDFCYMYWGPAALFDLPNNMNALISIQWCNNKEYTSETVGNLWFQDRVYKDWYVIFSRIVVSVGWSF